MSLPVGVLLDGQYEHTRLVRLVQTAEASGFDSFYYGDERFLREPYVGLTACALGTTTIKLATGVTDPYSRHPALTAAAIASLDEVSGGRAVLGIGAGTWGFKQLGLSPTHAATAMREAILILRKLFAGESVSLHGDIISIFDGQMLFDTRADIPIVVAGDKKHTLRLAGEVGDGAMIVHCGSPELQKPKLAEIEAGTRRAGRAVRPRLVSRLDVSVCEDRQRALDAARLRMARYMWARYPNLEYLTIRGLALPEELARRLAAMGPYRLTKDLRVFEETAKLIPDELVAPVIPAGTPADVTASLRALADAGANEFCLYPMIPAGESLETVIPLLGTVAQQL
jgi:5,10-methylenetetrahydromethanopterin reductase